MLVSYWQWGKVPHAQGSSYPLRAIQEEGQLAPQQPMFTAAGVWGHGLGKEDQGRPPTATTTATEMMMMMMVAVFIEYLLN